MRTVLALTLLFLVADIAVGQTKVVAGRGLTSTPYIDRYARNFRDAIILSFDNTATITIKANWVNTRYPWADDEIASSAKWNAKLSASDTSSLSARILGRADSSLALYWGDSSALLAYTKTLGGGDTASLSNRINAKADSSLALYWPDTTVILSNAKALINARADSSTAFYWPDTTLSLTYTKALVGARADSSTAVYWADTTLANGPVTNYDIPLKLNTADTASLSARIGARADSSLAVYWPDTTVVLANVKALIGARADSGLALYWPDTTVILTNAKAQINARADSSTALYWADTTLVNGVATNYDLSLKQSISEKGGVNGYAGLGANSIVPTAQLGSGSASASTYLCGDQSWVTPSVSASPFYWTRRYCFVYANVALATATVVGMAAPTLTITAATNDQTTAPFIKHSTSTTANNVSGLISANFSQVRRSWEPEFATEIFTDATMTSICIWVGLFSAALDSNRAPNTHIAAFRYSTSDGTAFWRTVTNAGSGAGQVTTATTTAIAASTVYRLRITCANATPDVKFYVNDVLVATHTGASLPTSTQLLGYGVRVATLTTAARIVSWGNIALSMN